MFLRRNEEIKTTDLGFCSLTTSRVFLLSVAVFTEPRNKHAQYYLLRFRLKYVPPANEIAASANGTKTATQIMTTVRWSFDSVKNKKFNHNQFCINVRKEQTFAVWLLTRQANPHRVIDKAVWTSIDYDSQIDLKVVLPEVLDHEATVSPLFPSNQLRFPSVHLQHIRLIGVKNIRFDCPFPVDTDLASVKMRRRGKWTVYDHIWAQGSGDVPRHIDTPRFSWVGKQKSLFFLTIKIDITWWHNDRSLTHHSPSVLTRRVRMKPRPK